MAGTLSLIERVLVLGIAIGVVGTVMNIMGVLGAGFFTGLGSGMGVGALVILWLDENQRRWLQ